MSGEFNLQEESISLASDPEAYTIEHELDVSSCSTAELDAHLSSAIDSVVNDPDSITHSSPTTFDVFRSILKYADSPNVSANILTKTLDQISSSLVTHANAVVAIGYEDMDAPMAHKTPLEMWAFLLQWFVVVAEKGAGKGEETRAVGRTKTTKSKKSAAIPTTFVWVDHIPHVLATMAKALRVPTQRIWRTSSEREAFVSCFTKPAYQLAETEAYLKNQDIKLGIYKVICLAVKFHSHAFGAQTSIIQNLTYFEHLAEYMAELLSILEKEFDFNQLGEEILRDVAGKSFAHNDQKGPKVFSRFLVRFAELSPAVVQKQMALLLSHLDSEVGLSHYMPGMRADIIGIPHANGYH
jgi:condensin complex subunit 1